MYLEEKDVKQILSIIDKKFAKVTVFMEILNPKFVKKNVEKSALSATFPTKSVFLKKLKMLGRMFVLSDKEALSVVSSANIIIRIVFD